MTTTLEIPSMQQVQSMFIKAITKPSERDKQVIPFQYLTADNAAGLARRFWAKVVKTDGCWEWTGAKVSKGYGSIKVEMGGGTAVAHRLAYELETGEGVPLDLTVDHLCFNKACVRVSHFEIVTAAVNTQRRWDKYRQEVMPFITHCPHRHELTEANTYVTPKGSRVCKTCVRTAGRKHDAKRGWRR